MRIWFDPLPMKRLCMHVYAAIWLQKWRKLLIMSSVIAVGGDDALIGTGDDEVQ